MGVSKSVVDPYKEWVWDKEVNFWHSYQLINVNALMVPVWHVRFKAHGKWEAAAKTS